MMDGQLNCKSDRSEAPTKAPKSEHVASLLDVMRAVEGALGPRCLAARDEKNGSRLMRCYSSEVFLSQSGLLGPCLFLKFNSDVRTNKEEVSLEFGSYTWSTTAETDSELRACKVPQFFTAIVTPRDYDPSVAACPEAGWFFVQTKLGGYPFIKVVLKMSDLAEEVRAGHPGAPLGDLQGYARGADVVARGLGCTDPRSPRSFLTTAGAYSPVKE